MLAEPSALVENVENADHVGAGLANLFSNLLHHRGVPIAGWGARSLPCGSPCTQMALYAEGWRQELFTIARTRDENNSRTLTWSRHSPLTNASTFEPTARWIPSAKNR